MFQLNLLPKNIKNGFGRSHVLQPKLKIGQPRDKYEQEADTVADRVMRMGEVESLRMQPIEEEEEMMQMQPIEEEEELQMMCDNCQKDLVVQKQPEEEEEEFIQPKSTNSKHVITAPENTNAQINNSKGSGSPLDNQTLSLMGSKFGADFKRVNIHTNHTAIQLNKQLNAQAFTVGNDIYFNNGKYNPSSQDGKRLLAHELTHTIQQGRNTVARKVLKSTRHLPKIVQRDKEEVQMNLNSSIPDIMMQEPDTKPTEKKKEKVHPGKSESGFEWPWHYLLKPIWEGYDPAKRKGIMGSPNSPDKLAVEQINAIMNIWYAGLYSGVYKSKFSKELTKVEKITGISDTTLTLINIAFPLNLKDHLSDSMGKAFEDHPWHVVLYGLPLYAGAVSANYGISKKVQFSLLLDQAIKKYTESPRQFARIFSQYGKLENFKPSSGFVFDWEPDKSLKLGTGVNLGSMFWHPKSDEEKKTYNGPELYLHFNMNHDLNPDSTEDVKSQYFGGLMGGSKGFYGFAEGGTLLDKDRKLRDWYLRTGLMLRDLGPVTDMKTSFEMLSPYSGSNRYRLNATGSINFLPKSNDWDFKATASLGGLIPNASSTGGVDFGTALSLAHKPSGLSGNVGLNYQSQDIFNADSPPTWKLKTQLGLFKWVNLSAEYAKGSETGEFRFFLNFGPNLYKKKE